MLILLFEREINTFSVPHTESCVTLLQKNTVSYRANAIDAAIL